MENILKKALGEVLTQTYSEELRDSYDTGYKFSDEFEEKMNGLVRSTTRPPIYRYRGWLAAAACAVLAVGSAVLIPTLVNNKVVVAVPEESNSTTEPVPSESVTDEKPDKDLDDDLVITTSESVTTSASSAPETADTTTSETTQRPDETDRGTDQNSEEKPKKENDETPVVDSADSNEKETVTDEPGGETHNISVPAGTKLSQVFEDNFDISFDKLWAKYAEYCPYGTHTDGRYGSVYCSNAEYAFLQDFVHSLGDAESIEDGFAIDTGEPYISISVSPQKSEPDKQIFRNNSSWKYYDQFFNVPDTDSDDVEFPDETSSGMTGEMVTNSEPAAMTTPAFTVKIYKNSCCMSFGYIESFNTATKLTDLYMIGFFKMNKEASDKLFADFSALYLSGEPATVGDFSAGLGITADNISTVTADANSIYDTEYRYATLSPEYAESFFGKHASKKLFSTVRKVTGEDGNIYNSPVIVIDKWRGGFTVTLKNGALIRVKLSTDGKCVITDGSREWYFDIILDDIREVMKAAADANGFAIPFFSTLGEYLEGKHFDDLTCVECDGVKKDGKTYNVRVRDEGDLKMLRDMIISVADSADYLPGCRFRSAHEATIYVHGYNSPIFLRDDDVLYIHTFSHNHFRLPEGFSERFINAVTGCASAEWTEAEPEGPMDEPDRIVSNDAEEEEAAQVILD